MTQKSFVSTALPTPEVIDLMNRFHLPEHAIDGWFDYPILSNGQRPMSRADLLKNAVDFESILAPFFGLKKFFGSIHKMDLAVGCSKACGTCLAKAPLPSRIFSTVSLYKGFNNPEVLRMLNPFYLRIGNTSEPTDQPDFPEILKLILDQTKILDVEAQKIGRRHFVAIYTNYRPNSEDVLDELLELAKSNDRLEMIISLPVNKSDFVNEKFILYTQKRPQIFFVRASEWFMGFQTYYPNISVFNVGRINTIFPIGRRLSDEILNSKGNLVGLGEIDAITEYKYRGMVEVFVNPEAFWLIVWSTIHQSSTLRSFTPFNAINHETLSQLPWINYFEFTTPKNWPGGTGTLRSIAEAKSLRELDQTPFQKVDIIY